MSGKQARKQRQQDALIPQVEAAIRQVADKHLQVPHIPEALRDKFLRKITLRGKTYEMAADKDSVAVPLFCSLLALEDDRIDAMLKAFKVKLVDAKGIVVFPLS